MHKSTLHILLGSFLSLMISACATHKKDNFSHLDLVQDPIVKSSKAPLFDDAKYKTFTVISSRHINDSAMLKESVEESQLLFYIISLVEIFGYKFVGSAKEADLVFVIDATTKYEQHYVPPRQVTVPRYVPGETITTYSNHHGTAHGSAFGSGGYAFGSANYSGSSTSSTYIPGYTTYDTYTKPGYWDGYYYPVGIVQVYEMPEAKLVWEGSGAGTTRVASLAISSQDLWFMILADFPLSKHFLHNLPKIELDLDSIFLVRSADGQNFYPTIWTLKKSSMLRRAGLRKDDIILEFNGVSAAGLLYSTFLKALEAQRGQEVTFKVKRMKQTKTVTFTVPVEETITNTASAN